MNHPLCNQTVTLYTQTKEGLQRRVVRGCFYHYCRERLSDGLSQTRFTLILPGEEPVQIGTRVLPGIGPEQVDFQTFLPVNTPGLGQVAYVEPYYLDGRLHHWEAGRK